MIPILDEKRHDLIDLCRTFRVTRLDVFGSAARGTFREAVEATRQNVVELSDEPSRAPAAV